MSRGVPISEQATDIRLGPARAHDIVRHRLGRLARRWRLSSADMHRLAQQMETSTYVPGQMVVPRGARADCLGLIIRGQVAVYDDEGGGERPRLVLLPGSTFGEMMLAEGRPSSATLQARTAVQIRYLRRADLLALRARRRRVWRSTGPGAAVRVGAALLLLLVLLLLLARPGARQALLVAPMGLGQWCWDHGQPTCTAAAWQAAASLTPADPGPRLALGTFYFEQGNMAAAERAFRQAGELAPDLPEVYNNLGLIYARRGQHDRAIDAFEQALELEPGVASVEDNLAYSLQARGRYEEALEHYAAALALDEPRAKTLLNMAIAYYEAGRPEEAGAAAQQVLSYGGDQAAAYALLAAVDLELGQPERALAHLEQALYLDPGYEQAHFYQGLAYKALEQREAAIEAFKQALNHADDEDIRTRILEYLDELDSSQGARGGGGPD